MWSIRQTSDGWELIRPDGTVAAHNTYDAALRSMADEIAAVAPAANGTSDDGLLPEAWEDVGDGIVLAAETGPHRDFSQCTFTWRDPAVTLVPTMLQTDTEPGHFGAKLAGFARELHWVGRGVGGSGRFYDTEVGREARDLLLGGRRFGVSADPGEHTAVDITCLEEDEEGWCISERMSFIEYEVAGLTMTPFPGFDRTAIRLVGEAPAVAASGERAGGCGCHAAPGACACDAAPVVAAAPPATVGVPALRREWFLGPADDAPVVPFEATDDGYAFGWAALWGSCHIGHPDVCVTPPRSESDYAYFRLGLLPVGDEEVAVGNITMGTGHAPLDMNAMSVPAHYDNTGTAAVDVVPMDLPPGIFYAGALRPDLEDHRLRTLRASGGVSGDWRRIRGHLEMVALLAVNVPGFPVPRTLSRQGVIDTTLVSSGHVLPALPTAQARVEHGNVTALVAAGAGAVMARAERPSADPLADRVATLEAQLARYEDAFGAELRTRLATKYVQRIRSA